MTSLIFPDVNVWLALSYPAHSHHEAAVEWFSSLSEGTMLVFCRHTQLGLFRLLTTNAVLQSDVRTQRQCWEIYDGWIEPGRATFCLEPFELDDALRTRSQSSQASPKQWADAYLSAFAEAAGLTMVTFDKALASKAKGATLLGQLT